jgi:hypothetical protein
VVLLVLIHPSAQLQQLQAVVVEAGLVLLLVALVALAVAVVTLALVRRVVQQLLVKVLRAVLLLRHSLARLEVGAVLVQLVVLEQVLSGVLAVQV